MTDEIKITQNYLNPGNNFAIVLTNTIDNYYTKNETYNKKEVDELIQHPVVPPVDPPVNPPTVDLSDYRKKNDYDFQELRMWGCNKTDTKPLKIQMEYFSQIIADKSIHVSGPPPPPGVPERPHDPVAGEEDFDDRALPTCNAVKNYVKEKIEAIPPPTATVDLSNYYTKAEIDDGLKFTSPLDHITNEVSGNQILITNNQGSFTQITNENITINGNDGEMGEGGIVISPNTIEFNGVECFGFNETIPESLDSLATLPTTKAVKNYVDKKITTIPPSSTVDLSNYYTKTEITNILNAGPDEIPVSYTFHYNSTLDHYEFIYDKPPQYGSLNIKLRANAEETDWFIISATYDNYVCTYKILKQCFTDMTSIYEVGADDKMLWGKPQPDYNWTSTKTTYSEEAGSSLYIHGYPPPNTTIIHNAPLEEPLKNYSLGKPVFMSGKIFKLQSNRYVQKYTATDCIPSVKTTGTYKEFLGIVVGIHDIGYCNLLEPTIDFATHGDYVFWVEDSSIYSVGDALLYTGQILSDSIVLTSKICSMRIGVVSAILSKTEISIFKS